MSEKWTIHATLEEAASGYALFMKATRTVNGKVENTSDFVHVTCLPEARHECSVFANTIGAEGYTLEERRKPAA